MMNIVALCLVFTTLATAGVWSPSPTPETEQNIKQDVIVKEGLRTVEIVYGEDDHGNTKVKISPQEGLDSSSPSAFSNLKGKVSDEAEKSKEKLEEEIGHRAASPREIVCDAFGKCKHKIATAVGKTKEVLSEKAQGVREKVEEVEGEAKHAAEETFGRMKDAVAQRAHEAAEKARETKETVRKATKEATDVGKTLKEDVKKNASKEFEGTRRRVGEVGEKMEQKKKDLGEFVGDVFGYVLSPGLRASGVGVLQLLGLSVAYGMSVWVTFISSYIMAGALPRQQFAILQSKIYPVYFRTMAYSVGLLLFSHCLSSKKGLFSSGKAEIFQGFNLFASLLMLLLNLRYLEPLATKVMFERMKLEKEEGKGVESPTIKASVRVIDSVIEPPGERSSSGARTTSAATPTATTRTSKTPQDKAAEADDDGAAAAAARSEMARLSEKLKRLNSYSSFLNILTLMALTSHLFHLGQMLRTSTAE